MCYHFIYCFTPAERHDLNSNPHFMASLNTHSEAKCDLINIKALLTLTGSKNQLCYCKASGDFPGQQFHLAAVAIIIVLR